MTTDTTAATDRTWPRIDAVLKLALVALLAFSATHTEWERFSDKAMTARAVLYPALVGLPILVWWLLRRRGHTRPYPAATSTLWTLPFVVDVGGNALNLYDTVDHFDDACHLLNWAVLSGAFGLLLLRPGSVGPWTLAALCTGFGATTAILWEIGEYGAFIGKTDEQFTAYRDTLGDLVLGLTGSFVAGCLCALAQHRARAGRRTGAQLGCP